MEFDTEAVFQATIDPQSLRDIRRTVEDEVGDLPVDVQMQASGGGVGGGRDWDIEHDLSRERNFLLQQLLDEQREGNFDRAVRSGGVGGALGLGLLGAGIAGLGSALGGLGDFKLKPPEIPDALDPVNVLVPPKLDPVDVPVPDALNPVDVPEPSWLPIDIPTPDWIPIPVDAPSSIPITFESPSTTTDPSGDPSPSPGPSPSPAPTTPPELEAPIVPDDGGGSGIPQGFPTGPPELNAPEVAAGVAAGGGGALLARETVRRVGGGAGRSTAAAPLALPSVIAAQTARRGNEREDPNVVERFFADLIPSSNRSRTTTEALTAENSASASRTSSINVSTEVRVDGTDRREVERIADQKANEAADKIRRNLTGNGF